MHDNSFLNVESFHSCDMPERNLWVEVLIEAIADLRKADHVRRSAENWFSSNRDEVGSFRWVCACLLLDASAVRRAVFTGPQMVWVDGRRRAR